VSFDKKFLQPKPNRDQSFRNEFLVAPFYTSVDMELANAGNIFYRVLDLLNDYSEITSSAVKQLEQIVKYSPNVPTDFTASTMLVVTWDKVLPRHTTVSSTTVKTKMNNAIS